MILLGIFFTFADKWKDACKVFAAMNAYSQYWVYFVACITGILAAVVYEIFIHSSITIWREEYIPDIFIAVLSARENFAERQSLRDTWIKSVKSAALEGKVEVMFVVGKYGCQISPSLRVNAYGCEKWNLTDHVIHDGRYHLFSENKNVSYKSFGEDKNVSVVPCARFIVQTPIVVEKVGVVSQVYQPVSFKLVTADGHDVLLSVSFTSDIGSERDGYRYKSIQPVALPHGFEGLIIIQNLPDGLKSNAWMNHNNDAQNFIHVSGMFTDEDGVNLSVGASYVSAGSIAFSLQEPECLRQNLLQQQKFMEDWAIQNRVIEHKLQDEIVKFKDILLADVVDTYENLPSKLLECFKRITNEKVFQFLLKTDDDCFLNVQKIYKEVLNINKSSNLWWSNFRINWAVQRYGKWRDSHNPAALYPPFACGTGYVLSHSLVLWLAKNAGHLYSYQGEDVSLGIWLSAIGPQFVQNSRWSCDSICSAQVFNIGQLNISDMYAAWEHYLHCDNPCGC